MKNALIFFVIVATCGYFGVKWKIHHDVEQGVDMAVMMMSPYATIEYDGVSSTLTGELTIDGIRGHVRGFADGFDIARLGIDTPSFLTLMKLGDVQSAMGEGDDLLPEYFGIIIEGLRMPADADYGQRLYDQKIQQLGVEDANDPANKCTGKYSFSPEALVAMGYSEYDISIAATFRQLGNRYAVEIESGSTDMWNFDVEMTLVGDMVTELAKGARYRPKMSEMRIEYTDRSINERVARYCGRLGLGDADVLAAQMEAFTYFGSEKGIVFDEYLIEPYKEFLGGKSTFIVTANPTEPVTLSQITLYKPSDVPALLQLSAEAQ